MRTSQANSRIARILVKNLRFFFQTITAGEGFEAKSFLQQNNQTKSFWRDIPLNSNGNFNYVNEIPYFTLAKMELNKTQPNHPITQDTRTNRFDKKTKELRYYAQFPLFNYGFLPQTWESSLISNKEGFFGDNDPLDVIELSDPKSNCFKIGSVAEVKILGSFCLIDQGELDWKLLAIENKLAQNMKINTLQQLEDIQPGRLNAIKSWFKFIKTYDGKKQNVIYFEEKIFSIDETLEIIMEMNHQYKELCHPETSSNKDPEGLKKLIALKKDFHL